MAASSRVNFRDSHAEEECSVCGESLKFSFRLPGEKPHIVPECGHPLHHECFAAAYGPISRPQTPGMTLYKTHYGSCTVCRRPMKVGDGGGRKYNKFAALTGMGDPKKPSLYPGRDDPSNIHPDSYDPNEEDPVDMTFSDDSDFDNPRPVVVPSIRVQPEFSSLVRTGEPSQALTCMVVVELPGTSPPLPLPVAAPIFRPPEINTEVIDHRDDTHIEQEDSTYPSPSQQSFLQVQILALWQPRPPNPPEYQENGEVHQPQEYVSYSALIEDLQHRVIAWLGPPISSLGPLQLRDRLDICHRTSTRTFLVYLFKKAIICVEEQPRELAQTSSSELVVSNAAADDLDATKIPLRFRGRIYTHHIKSITDTSVPHEDMSLTLEIEDRDLESFSLIFKTRTSLEKWKSHMQMLIVISELQNRQDSDPTEPKLESTGTRYRRTHNHATSTDTTASTADSILAANPASPSSGTSSHTSHSDSPVSPTDDRSKPPTENRPKLPTVNEDHVLGRQSPRPQPLMPPPITLPPLDHAPLDLFLVIALPVATMSLSAASIKSRLIKTSLEFILASLGAKDRLALVTFEAGVGGKVRKTPLLSMRRVQSRARLNKFIAEIGRRGDIAPVKDDFLIKQLQSDKVDVITAVNHGLDLVLQRKSRNPTSGMLLISDTYDPTNRAQMNMMLGRAEVANLPIHTFGFGRSHDMASLWLISSHTHATYTFVRDWYDLRSCLAGCIGGIMSIGMLNLKMHVQIVEEQSFRIRKVSGGPSALLSSDGRSVDIHVGELMFGERKELLLEIELELENQHTASPRDHDGISKPRPLSATDQFNERMGLDQLSFGDMPDLAEEMMYSTIDEVPVLEVDASYVDPVLSRRVSRLGHPVLLIITVLPRTSLPAQAIDPVIVRRRMELLVSEMLARTLYFVTRKNFTQAQRIMGETCNVLNRVLESVRQTLAPPGERESAARRRLKVLTLLAIDAIKHVLRDVCVIVEALDGNVSMFVHDQRNLAAQQVSVLRDQRSWSSRTSIERLYWTVDNCVNLVSRSIDWVSH